MIKSLTNWFRALFVRQQPTALEVMKKSLYEAEITYLATVNNQEYFACEAEKAAIEVRHDFRRYQRLQKFIHQEERSQAEVTGSGLDERALEVLLSAVATDLNSLFPKREEAQQAPEQKA